MHRECGLYRLSELSRLPACAKQHGTCGVKERIGVKAEQHANTPFVGSWNVVSSDGPGREETLQADGSAVTADEGAGRWTVANGHLFVRFDDPASEQQAYDVSANADGGVFNGQDQAGHKLTLERRTGQPVSTAPEPLAADPGQSDSNKPGRSARPSSHGDSGRCPASSAAIDLRDGHRRAERSRPSWVRLGSRATNPRLKRILYYLAVARDGGADPAEIIEQAQRTNGSLRHTTRAAGQSVSFAEPQNL